MSYGVVALVNGRGIYAVNLAFETLDKVIGYGCVVKVGRKRSMAGNANAPVISGVISRFINRVINRLVYFNTLRTGAVT